MTALLQPAHAARTKHAMQHSRISGLEAASIMRRKWRYSCSDVNFCMRDRVLAAGSYADAARGAHDQDWGDGPRAPQVHDAEFSVAVASPEEAARAAEERRQEEEEAAMQDEVPFWAPFASAYPPAGLQPSKDHKCM